MKILAKFPTRQRPQIFLDVLNKYIQLADDNTNIFYLITCDNDDHTMTDDVIKKAEALLTHKNIKVCRGDSKTKIEAVNADFINVSEHFSDWDIVLIISDDMEVQAHGWDTFIRNKMKENYPLLDGCLWLHDGSKQRSISTISCIGRKYYDRFNYIYHPSYKSMWCDNEYTEVALSNNKITFIEEVIIKHQHPCWGADRVQDPLYIRNDLFWKHDSENYEQRKKNGFN